MRKIVVISHAAADVRCWYRETAKLINSALMGSTDVEMTGASLLAPAWVQKSEKIRVDLSLLKDRLHKLKE